MNALTAKAVLRRNYLFRGLPEAAIEKIAALAARRAFHKGAVVFVQGDEGDALYGVVSGQVRISTSTADGREVFLNIMEPGDAPQRPIEPNTCRFQAALPGGWLV